MKFLTIFSWLFLLFNGRLFAQNNFSGSLIGKGAPPLTIGEWIKGGPVNSFDRGQIYVVEFTAVLCAPCRKAIPHLSEINRNYKGKVTVVSIYTAESNVNDSLDLRYLKRVHELVSSLDNKMDFIVSVDVPQQKTKKDWHSMYTPNAFIVDRKGIVVWSGTPMEMDTVLGKVVQDEFTVDDAKRLDQAQTDLDVLLDNICSMGNSPENYRNSIRSIDSLSTLYPSKIYLKSIKYHLLAGNDDSSANTLLREMLSSNDSYDWVWLVNKVITQPVKPDYSLALAVADRTIANAESPQTKADLMRSRVMVYIRKNDLPEAIKECKKAMDFCRSIADTLHYNVYEDLWLRLRYQHLARTNERRANTLLKKIIDSDGNNIDWLQLLNNVKEIPARPDYVLRIKVIDRALKHDTSQTIRYILTMDKADAYSLMGDKKRALKTYEDFLLTSGAGITANQKKEIEDRKRKISL